MYGFERVISKEIKPHKSLYEYPEKEDNTDNKFKVDSAAVLNQKNNMKFLIKNETNLERKNKLIERFGAGNYEYSDIYS